MISEVVAFTGIALDSPLGFINGVLLVLLVGAGVKAIFAVFKWFGGLWT